MWFYADNKSKPMSPTMTPKSVTPGKTPILRPIMTKPVSPGRTMKPGMTIRPTSPGVRPGMTIRPTSPSVRPPIVIKPGSPGVRPPIVIKPGSPPVRPPIVIKPGSPPVRPLPGITRPKPISPVVVIPSKPVSPTRFKGCPTGGSVSVPHVKYTLHQKPVVFEKVSKCVSQNQVPITYEFEKKQHPIKVVKSPCSPCGGRKTIMPHGRGGFHKAMSPCGVKNLKYPCSMQSDWHLNRPPCLNKNKLGKAVWSPAMKGADSLGQKWWMGKNAATSCSGKSPCNMSFPRWQSQYVPQGKSPCMVATKGNCQRKRCGSC